MLLLSYEAMKADLPACVARVASHLGLSPSPELMATCLSRMDFAWMKAHEERFSPRSVAWLDKGDGFSFVRQGKVGGGALDLSAEQREAIERSCWRAEDRWSSLVGEGEYCGELGGSGPSEYAAREESRQTTPSGDLLFRETRATQPPPSGRASAE